jgi:hydrogenase nickel incorporation protein HypA/HybF
VHELALTDGVVQMVRERVGNERVTLVRLEVGLGTAVVPDATRFCFEVCARGTSLEGAELQIDEVPGRIRCARCGGESELAEPIPLCPCGSAEVEVIAGRELRIKEVEVS